MSLLPTITWLNIPFSPRQSHEPAALRIKHGSRAAKRTV
jgi:hypothetical protein